ASPIPDTMPFEDAAVLPLATSTAACGLFQTDQLRLRHPSVNAEPTGQTLLVWGGSTSVGSNAIQLGASQVFDYNSPSVVPDIIAAFEGRTLAGAIAFGTTSAPSCVRIVSACKKGNKFVSIGSPPVSFEGLADGNRGRFELPPLILRLVTSNVALQVKARSRGVRTKYIFGTTLKANEVSAAIYRDFLPDALAEGRYVAAPKPSVVGHGVQDFQQAMDIQLKGVSAAKVVV